MIICILAHRVCVIVDRVRVCLELPGRGFVSIACCFMLYLVAFRFVNPVSLRANGVAGAPGAFGLDAIASGEARRPHRNRLLQLGGGRSLPDGHVLCGIPLCSAPPDPEQAGVSQVKCTFDRMRSGRYAVLIPRLHCSRVPRCLPWACVLGLPGKSGEHVRAMRLVPS
jgi:hypothetical protein